MLRCFPFPRTLFVTLFQMHLRTSKLLCLKICYTLHTTYVFSSGFQVHNWIQINDTFRRATIKRQKKTAYRPCHRLYKNTASLLAASACSGSLSQALGRRIDRLFSGSVRSCSKISGFIPSVLDGSSRIPSSLRRNDRLLRHSARHRLSASDSASAR